MAYIESYAAEDLFLIDFRDRAEPLVPDGKRGVHALVVRDETPVRWGPNISAIFPHHIDIVILYHMVLEVESRAHVSISVRLSLHEDRFVILGVDYD